MILWSRVNELREEIGAEDFDEVVDLFLEEVEDVLARMRSGGASDPANDLHFLKGSALNLGFSDFANLCLRGERLVASGRAGHLDLAEIVDCFARSREVLLCGLAGSAAA